MDNNDVRLNPRGEGLEALRPGAVGVVDTYVARFLGAISPLGPPPVSDWCQVVANANNGTTFKISRRGIYHVTLFIELAAVGVSVGAGISLDYLGPPQPANSPGMVGYQSVITAADVRLWCIPGIVSVPQSIALDPLQGIVRCLLDDGVGAPITITDITAASSLMRIVRVADLNSLA